MKYVANLPDAGPQTLNQEVNIFSHIVLNAADMHFSGIFTSLVIMAEHSATLLVRK